MTILIPQARVQTSHLRTSWIVDRSTRGRSWMRLSRNVSWLAIIIRSWTIQIHQLPWQLMSIRRYKSWGLRTEISKMKTILRQMLMSTLRDPQEWCSLRIQSSRKKQALPLVIVAKRPRMPIQLSRLVSVQLMNLVAIKVTKITTRTRVLAHWPRFFR